MGNEKALVEADIWQDILYDVKKKKCFFNAEEDKELAQVIVNVKCELNELDDLFDKVSTIFRAARWKVRTFLYLLNSFHFLFAYNLLRFHF